MMRVTVIPCVLGSGVAATYAATPATTAMIIGIRLAPS